MIGENAKYYFGPHRNYSNYFLRFDDLILEFVPETKELILKKLRVNPNAQYSFVGYHNECQGNLRI